jgi:hypothetical protein
MTCVLANAIGWELCADLYFYWRDKQGYDQILQMIGDPERPVPEGVSPFFFFDDLASPYGMLYGQFPVQLVYSEKRRRALRAVHLLPIPADFLAFFRASVMSTWIVPAPVTRVFDSGSITTAHCLHIGLHALRTKLDPLKAYDFIQAVGRPPIIYLVQRSLAVQRFKEFVSYCDVVSVPGNKDLKKYTGVTHVVTVPLTIARPRHINVETHYTEYAEECARRFMKEARHEVIVWCDAFLFLLWLVSDLGPDAVRGLLVEPEHFRKIENPF